MEVKQVMNRQVIAVSPEEPVSVAAPGTSAVTGM